MSDIVRFVVDTDCITEQVFYRPDRTVRESVFAHPAYIWKDNQGVRYDPQDFSHLGFIGDCEVNLELVSGGRVIDPRLPQHVLYGLSHYLQNESDLIHTEAYDCHEFMHQLLDTAYADDWYLAWDIDQNPRIDRMAPGSAITLCSSPRFKSRVKKHSAIKVDDNVYLSKLGQKGIVLTSLEEMQRFYNAPHVFGLRRSVQAAQYYRRSSVQPGFLSYLSEMY